MAGIQSLEGFGVILFGLLLKIIGLSPVLHHMDGTAWTFAQLSSLKPEHYLLVIVGTMIVISGILFVYSSRHRNSLTTSAQ
ncbi:MAG: hypothetical protein ACPGO3_03620 [Magnetospiraceae bacterium]